MKQYKVI